MSQTERLLLFLATEGNEAAAAVLYDEFDLVRGLLQRRVLSAEKLAEALRVRCRSGLLLQHCLVKVGAVGFDIMVEAMAERRLSRCPRVGRIPGDAGYGKDHGPLAG